MELVFTQDIPRANGAAWRKGDIADYPRGTWTAIAKSLGKKLNAFTRTVTEAAQISVASKRTPAKAKAKAKAKKAA